MSLDRDSIDSALDQLARRYGISNHFENAYGNTVAVSPETVALLLQSMGVQVQNPAEAQAMLDQLSEQDAARVLPETVVVVPVNGQCHVKVTSHHAPSPLVWQLTLEGGEVVDGSFHWQEASTTPHDGGIDLPFSDLPLGYHRLRLPQLSSEAHLIVSPGKCWLPEDVEGGYWGIAVQLNLIRSATNWGIGDFSDLAAFIDLAAAHGCDLVGLNPLHQMFLDDPEAASPYSPATRLFLNPIYIDVPAIPEWKQSPAAQSMFATSAFQERLEACRAAPLVQYADVTSLKITALRHVYDTFINDAAQDRLDAFAAFRDDGGASLARASLFQVLRQHFSQSSPHLAYWRRWPADLQAAGSQAQREFADQHRAEIEFQNWLQFIADEQLQMASNAARDKGMAVGLYRDLAVGCDAAGAETWANPAAFLERNLVGAPPDIFNPAGQNWGLPPFDPVALTREGYRSFAELIRANMSHAGGLRIDHVMGLRRLFCIPEGKRASEGAYVNFPLDDLIGVLALESQRQQCLVVGEDLGTVPYGFREQMANANVLSYRVLFFEQDFSTGDFLPPQAYPHLSIASTGSHDLPTLLAWWNGHDLVIKERLALFETAEEIQSQQERRNRERLNILSAFASAGLIEQNVEPSSLSDQHFAHYAHRYLAMTKSLLLATQLDDITGENDPVNVPGTSTEHPNWRRKYRLSLEDLAVSSEPWTLVAPLARTTVGLP
jgi:4-alpha-glucanotransferase